MGTYLGIPYRLRIRALQAHRGMLGSNSGYKGPNSFFGGFPPSSKGMPFTLSHPAAALPFSRCGLKPSALVLGSMLPDFVFFISLNAYRDFTHSTAGLFLFCLPVGLILFWFYEHFLKAPLRSLMPWWIQGAYTSRPIDFRPFKRLSMLALSILIGAATHLLWDSFTHESSWVQTHWPIMTRTVLDLGFDQVPLTRLLHHLSSVIGGALIVVWTRRFLARQRAKAGIQIFDENRNSRRIACVLILSGVFGILLSWGRQTPVTTYDQLRHMMVGSLFAFGSVILFFTFVYSFIWHYRSARQETRRSTSGTER